MPRPLNIPQIGDVTVKAVAQHMAISEVKFREIYPALVERGFPKQDPITGNFCIEAINRWRLNRHKELFPDLVGVVSVDLKTPSSDIDQIKNSMRAALDGQS